MKKKYIYFHIGLLCLFILMFAYSSISYLHLKDKMAEGKKIIKQTELMTISCTGGKKQQVSDYPFKLWKNYIKNLLENAKEEIHGNWFLPSTTDYEQLEISALRSILNALDRQNFEDLQYHSKKMAEIESWEQEHMSLQSFHWGCFSLGNSIFILALSSIYFSSIRRTYFSGKSVYSSSLRSVLDRFNTCNSADKYFLKRRCVEAFEEKCIRSSVKLVEHSRKILDIPCGTGRFIEFLQTLGMDYYGADSSEAMVALTTQRPQIPAPDRVNHCDIMKLPYADKSFDCIYVIRFFHHIPDSKDRANIFKQLQRVAVHGVGFTFFDAWSISHLFYILHHMVLLKPIFRHAISIRGLKKELNSANMEIKKVFYRRRWLNRSAFVLAVPKDSNEIKTKMMLV